MLARAGAGSPRERQRTAVLLTADVALGLPWSICWFALGSVRPANGRGLPFYSLGLTAEPWHWIARGVSPWYTLAKHTSNGGAVTLALCCDVALGLPWLIWWFALELVRPANGRGLPFYILGLTAEPWHWIARGVSPWYELAKHTSNGGAVALTLFLRRCVVIALVDVVVRAGIGSPR